MSYKDRTNVRLCIERELKKENWRPSYIRSLVRRMNDIDQQRLPDEQELKELLFFAARVCKSSIKGMTSKNRRAENVYARQILYWYLTEVRKIKEPKVGKMFGYDRTTVIHGRNKVNQELEINYKPTVEAIEKLNLLCES